MARIYICCAVFFGLPISSATATIELGGSVSDDIPSLVYDRDSGDLSVEGGGHLFTTLLIDAEPGLMKNCTTVGLIDTCPDRLFRLIPQGIETMTFDEALFPELLPETLRDGLSASGSIRPVGGFDSDPAFLGPNVMLIDLVYVPEPSTETASALLVAVLSLAIRRRKSV